MLSDQEHQALEALSSLAVLMPDLKKTSGRFYPAIFQPEDLDSLTAQGLAARNTVMFAPVCPGCSALMLMPNGSCPTCLGSALTTKTLLHHIACAGVFEAPEGVEQVGACPKCRSHITLDSELVERAGAIYICQTCEARFPDPVISMYCYPCKINYPLADVNFSQVYSYEITQAGKALLNGAT